MAPFGKSQVRSTVFSEMATDTAINSLSRESRAKRQSKATVKGRHSVTARRASSVHGRRKSHATFITQMNAADPEYVEAHHDNVYGNEYANALLDEINQDVVEEASFSARTRARLAHIVLSQRFEMCIGMVIMSNFLVIAFETDARSRKDNDASSSADRDFATTALGVIAVLNVLYLMIHICECCVRMYVFRWEYFNHSWNVFDLVIVGASIMTEVLGIIAMHSGVEGSQGLRTLRIIRMLRTSRVLVSFDELYALVSGLKNAMKTLMWAGCLILLVLTSWSILAVEYVKPLMAAIDSNGGFGTCTWCPQAFDTIPLANLTFFQMISGDGWSNVARPLIEGHAWTALLFVAVIFSMVFGLLNLIVAVIVDSAQQAREADIMNQAAIKDAARAAAWDCFSDMVDELDENADNDISVEELKKGIMSNHDLAAYLTVMGIEQGDLEMVFELLDADRDGHVSHEEFVHQLYQMKTQELPIAVCYIRHSVAKLHDDLNRLGEELSQKVDGLLGPKTEVANGNLKPGEGDSITRFPSDNKAKITSAGNDGWFPTVKRRETRVSLFAGRPRPTLRLSQTAAAPRQTSSASPSSNLEKPESKDPSRLSAQVKESGTDSNLGEEYSPVVAATTSGTLQPVIFPLPGESLVEAHSDDSGSSLSEEQLD